MTEELSPILLVALAKHAPVNMSHHLGRFSNGVDSSSSVLCACQPNDAPFMSEHAYREHLAAALTEEGIGVVADAKAEALREAALNWPGDMGTSEARMWLRDRAAAEERTDET